jgi:hypothetical protein
VCRGSWLFLDAENVNGSSESKLELNEDRGIGDSAQTEARLQSLTYEL